MTEDINLMHFLSLMCFWALNPVHLPWTFWVFECPLGTSESFLCFVLVRLPKLVPPPGAPLRQIQFVINCISSEGKLSHSVSCDIILFQHYIAFYLISYVFFYSFYLFVFCLFVCFFVLLRLFHL
jgi:hypothetical protein